MNPTKVKVSEQGNCIYFVALSIPDHRFDLTELCQHLPDKLAKPEVYAYFQHCAIPYHKKVKKLFFLKSEIDLYLKSGHHSTSAEIVFEVDEYFTNKKR